LPRIAEPGIGPVGGLREGQGTALAAIRRQTHIRGADPVLDRTGSGDLEKCLAGASRRFASEPAREGITMCSPVTLLEFEHLSHVAANLQSLFVHAGHVISFCFANEQ